MVSARINLDSFFNPNEKRIRVAFVKFCGMATGGTEKVLQTIASNLDKNKIDQLLKEAEKDSIDEKINDQRRYLIEQKIDVLKSLSLN